MKAFPIPAISENSVGKMIEEGIAFAVRARLQFDRFAIDANID